MKRDPVSEEEKKDDKYLYDEEEIINLSTERDFLIERLSNVENLMRKQAIIENIIDLSNDLKDDESIVVYQKKLQLIKREIEDTKLKTLTFLKRAKEMLSESIKEIGQKALIQGDYKNAYINLYSFSTKLQKISSDDIYLKYREMAKALIDKDESKEDQLSQVITEILNLSDETIEKLIN